MKDKLSNKSNKSNFDFKSFSLIIDKLSEEVSSSSFPIIEQKTINNQLSLIKSFVSRGIMKKTDLEVLKEEFLAQWKLFIEFFENIISTHRTKKKIAYLTGCFYHGRDLFMKLLSTEIKNLPISNQISAAFILIDHLMGDISNSEITKHNLDGILGLQSNIASYLEMKKDLTLSKSIIKDIKAILRFLDSVYRIFEEFYVVQESGKRILLSTSEMKKGALVLFSEKKSNVPEYFLQQNQPKISQTTREIKKSKSPLPQVKKSGLVQQSCINNSSIVYPKQRSLTPRPNLTKQCIIQHHNTEAPTKRPSSISLGSTKSEKPISRSQVLISEKSLKFKIENSIQSISKSKDNKQILSSKEFSKPVIKSTRLHNTMNNPKDSHLPIVPKPPLSAQKEKLSSTIKPTNLVENKSEQFTKRRSFTKSRIMIETSQKENQKNTLDLDTNHKNENHLNQILEPGNIHLDNEFGLIFENSQKAKNLQESALENENESVHIELDILDNNISTSNIFYIECENQMLNGNLTTLSKNSIEKEHEEYVKCEEVKELELQLNQIQNMKARNMDELLSMSKVLDSYKPIDNKYQLYLAQIHNDCAKNYRNHFDMNIDLIENEISLLSSLSLSIAKNNLNEIMPFQLYLSELQKCNKDIETKMTQNKNDIQKYLSTINDFKNNNSFSIISSSFIEDLSNMVNRIDSMYKNTNERNIKSISIDNPIKMANDIELISLKIEQLSSKEVFLPTFLEKLKYESELELIRDDNFEKSKIAQNNISISSNNKWSSLSNDLCSWFDQISFEGIKHQISGWEMEIYDYLNNVNPEVKEMIFDMKSKLLNAKDDENNINKSINALAQYISQSNSNYQTGETDIYQILLSIEKNASPTENKNDPDVMDEFEELMMENQKLKRRLDMNK